MLNRRRFLVGTAAASMAFVPATSLLASSPDRTIRFSSVHWSETLDVTYFRDGQYDPLALDYINYFLRDWRDHTITEMDPALIDYMWAVAETCGARDRIKIICGYRSPETNAARAAQRSGVARNSLHVHGQAVDMRIDDVPLSRLRQVAVDMNRGGVGYYPRSNFIHVDTGQVRTW